MAYDLTVERKPTYLHVTATGTRSEENARRFLVDAYRASIEHECGSLLLEMKLSGPPLSLASIFSVIVERSPDGANLTRIAYVDDQPEDSAEFAELVALNRGVNVRLFRRLSDAARWLSTPLTAAADRSAIAGSLDARPRIGGSAE
jgi:hypothetical protein